MKTKKKYVTVEIVDFELRREDDPIDDVHEYTNNLNLQAEQVLQYSKNLLGNDFNSDNDLPCTNFIFQGKRHFFQNISISRYSKDKQRRILILESDSRTEITAIYQVLEVQN